MADASRIIFKTGDTPPNPPAGKMQIYPKSGGHFYTGDDVGTETIIVQSVEDLSESSIYPDRCICMMLASAIADRFECDTSYLAESCLKNLFLERFADTSKIESSSNIEISSSKLRLENTAGNVQWDNCDMVGLWVEYNYPTEAVLFLDNVVYHEGTGSLKIEYTTTGSTQHRYSIKKQFTSEDWTSYSKFKFWVKSTYIGSQLRLYVRNQSPYAGVYYYYTTQSTDWEFVELDLNQLNYRNTIYYITIYFTRESTTYVTNIDDFRLEYNPVYQTSGYIISNTFTPTDGRNIYEMVKGIKYNKPTNTNVIVDISLDNGNHWKTDVGLLYFDSWLQTSSGGVLETADGGTVWDNKKNTKIKLNLSTTVSGTTPVVYDYAVIWRADKI